MTDKYDSNSIETKWQDFWAKNAVYQTPTNAKNKKYVLDMFPYPSGAGLHVGHIEGYTGTDVLSRYYRMKGFSVLHPIGWDAFGLPAENYAIKNGIPPDKSTHDNIKMFKSQINRAGLSYDWEREIDSSSPEYYKWTQWLFILLFKHKLAYKKMAPANWCPKDETVLANEQVVDGKCERCGTEVVQKDLEQWFFKITDFADRLIAGLDHVDWPKSTVLMQKNWIGRKDGELIKFKLKTPQGQISSVEVFTTRPDTIFSVTFLALAPEHELSKTLASKNEQIAQYLNRVKTETNLQREHLNKKKTGVVTLLSAVNPADGREVPIFIADYVLSTTGTGALMGVPAYDERDMDFAKEFKLPVIKSELTKKSFGQPTKTYHLRDWLVSRQRYWGAPIPMIFCDKCGWNPVPEEQLPVVLPTDVDFTPTGESPITKSKTFQLGVKCPNCSGPGKREVDTMDTFVDSSWYFLRFCDSQNNKEPWDKEKVTQWAPVDIYVGGAEHTVLHLMYSRFFYKFFFDLGMIDKTQGDEPFLKLRHQGTVLGPDSRKMSKRWGNVINPTDVVNQYGADTLRIYEMFMGPFEGMKPWSTESVAGVSRFLVRVYSTYLLNRVKISENKKISKELEIQINALLQKTTMDIENFSFNTSVAAMMGFLNLMSIGASEETGKLTWREMWEKFLLTLAPFAPFLSEELFCDLTNGGRIEGYKSIHQQSWPMFDKKILEQSNNKIPVTINSKLRGTLEIPDVGEDEARLILLKSNIGIKHLNGVTIKKFIYVPGRIINVITG